MELHGVTLAHSALQSIYNVLIFKQTLEEKNGPMTADAVAEYYDKHVTFADPNDAAPWWVTSKCDLH